MLNPNSGKLIAANWKMNFDHMQSISFLEELLWYVDDASKKHQNVAQICILPSFTSIRSVQTVLSASRTKILYGAQDVSAHLEGAFTGEVSVHFLKKLGCSFALVGHSERRANFSETTELCAQKIDVCFLNKINPILCVGESLRVDDATSAKEVSLEVKKCISLATGLNTHAASSNTKTDIYIAYEPLWAIGSGLTPEFNTIEYIISSIKDCIYHNFPNLNPRVLYGGSANHNNARAILSLPSVDGLLVGSASLDISLFCKILNAACV